MVLIIGSKAAPRTGAHKKNGGPEGPPSELATQFYVCLELGLCTQEEGASVHIVVAGIGHACAIIRQAVGRRVHATLGLAVALHTLARLVPTG